MVDYTQVRRTMVDSQLRTFDVNDIPLLDVMSAVPRERFVLPGREAIAYIDQDVPVSEGAEPRLMLKPMVLARMIQALEIREGDRILDVACGRGYSSAVMAKLGGRVIGLEASESLATTAQRCLVEAGVGGIEVRAGALEAGYAAEAPYDAILINGAVGARPEGLLNQLSENGRLACVHGRGGAAQAMLYVRSGNAFGARPLFNGAAPVLAAFQPKPEFVFQ